LTLPNRKLAEQAASASCRHGIKSYSTLKIGNLLLVDSAYKAGA
jgi:hypothetical protein